MEIPHVRHTGDLAAHVMMYRLHKKHARDSGSVEGVVTAKTQYSLTNAKDYFTEHLCVGGYYEEGHRVPRQ